VCSSCAKVSTRSGEVATLDEVPRISLRVSSKLPSSTSSMLSSSVITALAVRPQPSSTWERASERASERETPRMVHAHSCTSTHENTFSLRCTRALCTCCCCRCSQSNACMHFTPIQENAGMFPQSNTMHNLHHHARKHNLATMH